jgi:hypothetical protein
MLGYLRAQPEREQRGGLIPWRAVAFEAVGNGIAHYAPRE